MKQLVYTLLVFVFIANANAQELQYRPEFFFKPDTILKFESLTYRGVPEIVQKQNYLYEQSGKIGHVETFSYDKDINAFKPFQSEEYVYDEINRLKEVKLSPGTRFKYYYNEAGLDSLYALEYLTNQVWRANRTREKKYNSNNAIISEVLKKSNSNTLIKSYEKFCDYDIDGNLIQILENYYNDNLQNDINVRYRYTYTYEGGRIKSEIYDAKTFITSDTTWSNQYKHDYIYVDGDNKVDKKINSIFSSTLNAYVSIDTFRYTYTPNLWVEEKSTIRFTKQFDDNGNEIFYSVERKRSNGVWTKESQNYLVYDNNQVIAKEVFYVDPNDTNQEMYLLRKEVFGYRKLSNSEDIKFNENLNIMLYPNPSQNVAFIDGGDLNIQKMTLYNMHGQMMKAYGKSSTFTQIERDELKYGTYYLMIETDQGTITKPIIFTE